MSVSRPANDNSAALGQARQAFVAAERRLGEQLVIARDKMVKVEADLLALKARLETSSRRP